jgi:hypothetical protein
MRLRPTITFDQYKATFRVIAAAKPKVDHKRSWQYYLVLALVCLALGLAPHFPPTRIPAFTLYVALMLCWAFYKPLAKHSQEKCLRRFYDQEQAKLNDQILAIDETGISCNQGDGQAVSHQTWRAFILCIDTPDAFVFLPSPNTFVRVPKTTLTPSEQDLIRQWGLAVPRLQLNQ